MTNHPTDERPEAVTAAAAVRHVGDSPPIPPEVLAAREAAENDPTMIDMQQVADLLNFNISSIRKMHMWTRQKVDTSKPLTSLCLPPQDNPRGEKPRWRRGTIVRYGLAKDDRFPDNMRTRLRWTGPDSAELEPVPYVQYGRTKGSHNQRKSEQRKKRDRDLRRVVRAYLAVKDEYAWKPTARDAVAANTRLPRARVVELLEEAARDPERYPGVEKIDLKAESERLRQLVVERYDAHRMAESAEAHRAGDAAAERAMSERPAEWAHRDEMADQTGEPVGKPPWPKKDVAAKIAAELRLATGSVLNLLNQAGRR
jgi:hypothetical protein